MNPGSYFIIAAADYANAQSESSEANNLRSAPITLTLPPLPDSAVASVSAQANALPGQPIEFVWVVTNRGAATAAGTWYENVFVTNTASGQQSLTMLVFSNSLPAGGFLLRTQAVSLAFNGPAGALWFQVGVDSNDIVGRTMNFGTATNSTAVPLVLTFQAAATQIAEDAANPNIRCTVTRNGDRSQALSVTVSNSDATELSAPASVTIPAGQSTTVFDATVVHDGIVDGSQTATIGVSPPASRARSKPSPCWIRTSRTSR